MGMYKDTPLTPGPVAFLSQSGGHCNIYTMQGPAQGITFSKVISYGNALVMDSTDYLEYLATDPETGIICMYIEGVKDGAKFKKLVTQLTPEKPIVIWKAGLTPFGARTATTHTGSMAGDEQAWDAFFKQTGAIGVDSLEEMADIAMTLLRLKPSPGARVAIWGGGGGNSVAAGDVCAREGLDAPALSDGTKARLMDCMSLVNQIIVNPLDAGSLLRDAALFARTLEIVAADPNIDIILLHLGMVFSQVLEPQNLARLLKCITDFNRQGPSGKPLVVAINDQGLLSEAEKTVRSFREAGITTYGSLPRACRALSRFARYHKFVGQTVAST